jgi:Ca-activated chloride channel homolog
VSVDARDRPLASLNREAFKVFENGAPQEIKIFRREDIPVSLGIAIDDSASMRPSRSRVEAAALSLVRASNPRDEVFIVNFNDDAFLDVHFTNDPHKLEEGLARIDSAGGTAMRDAINLSLDYTKAEAKKDKKVLLVITDGNDNASRVPLDRLVQKAAQSEVAIYAIGLFGKEDRGQASEAKHALKQLTSQTGGLVFYPKDVDTIQQLALEIAQDIRSQYTIAYSPRPQLLDGSYRKIKVTVDGTGKPVVRTRAGYYALPDAVTAGSNGAEIKRDPR